MDEREGEVRSRTGYVCPLIGSGYVKRCILVQKLMHAGKVVVFFVGGVKMRDTLGRV